MDWLGEGKESKKNVKRLKSVCLKYLERCCGKQSWLGRPDALEPGVLTDCDLVWWGDPYLKEEAIKTSIPLGQVCCRKTYHNKLVQFFVDKFQMFPSKLTSIITETPLMKSETNGFSKENININPILPRNSIWAVLRDEKHLACRSSWTFYVHSKKGRKSGIK